MHLAPNVSCLKTKSMPFQMEYYWRAIQKSVDRKEILKVNAVRTGNEGFKDNFKAKRYSVFPVFRNLRKCFKYSAHLKHKYVGQKPMTPGYRTKVFSARFSTEIQKFDDALITDQT